MSTAITHAIPAPPGVLRAQHVVHAVTAAYINEISGAPQEAVRPRRRLIARLRAARPRFLSTRGTEGRTGEPAATPPPPSPRKLKPLARPCLGC